MVVWRQRHVQKLLFGLPRALFYKAVKNSLINKKAFPPACTKRGWREAYAPVSKKLFF